MNKRKEPISIQMQKKENKEVRKGLRAGDTPAAKTPKILKKALPDQEIKTKTHKKGVSKRTSTDENIEGSAPAHLHIENERWSMAVTRQNVLNANRLRKKMSKKRHSPGRII